MNRLKKTRNQIVVLSLVLGGIIALLLGIFLENKIGIVLGVAFGTLIAILNFIELEKTLIKASKMIPRKAQSYTTKHYFIRYLITGLVVLISIKADYINEFGTIIGLLLIKFVIMITNLFNDKEYFKRIFRKEG
ncbi:ATP synthase subunit I [Clostridiaceae bacterium HSG29]|nr:ATP synthase subunit I [Clostridiaceae bacterium HSG29]